jgi:hypothetical protein
VGIVDPAPPTLRWWPAEHTQAILDVAELNAGPHDSDAIRDAMSPVIVRNELPDVYEEPAKQGKKR